MPPQNIILPRSIMPTLLQTSESSGRMWLETMIVFFVLRSSFSRFRKSIRAAG